MSENGLPVDIRVNNLGLRLMAEMESDPARFGLLTESFLENPDGSLQATMLPMLITHNMVRDYLLNVLEQLRREYSLVPLEDFNQDNVNRLTEEITYLRDTSNRFLSLGMNGGSLVSRFYRRAGL